MQRALLIHAGALGDFILSLRIVASLRDAGAEHITVLGRSEYTRLARMSALIDESWHIDTGGWHALFSSDVTAIPDTLRETLATFDMAVDMLGGPNGRAADQLRRSDIRTVYSIDSRHRPDWTVHITDQWLTDLTRQGFVSRADSPIIQPDSAAMESARKRLESFADNTHQPVAMLHPGSGAARKCWPTGRFLETARELRRFGWCCVFLIGPVEQECMNAETLSAFRAAAPTLESPDILDTAALLASCNLYIGNDSGVSHLAGAVGTTAIVLFRSTSARVWAPRGPRVRVLDGAGHWPTVAQVLAGVTSMEVNAIGR